MPFAAAAARHALLALSLLAALPAALASAEVPIPDLEGPITGPGFPFLSSTTFDLAQVGYEQVEYFVSGTARAYTAADPLGSDGVWSVAEGESAAYRTRILVYRPVDPRRFGGTVIVEWLNVSGGLDAAAHWGQVHVEALRQGAAWVGVSAQLVGVEGGPPLVGLVSLPLKGVNPDRYGTLVHPGDSFSYDLFSQVGRLLREAPEGGPLAGLRARRFIAAGESQSAMRLVTYVDAVHPVARVFDGFLVHSRAAMSAPLSEAPQPEIPVPAGALVREDVGVPVLTFQTETDLSLLGSVAVRQPDSRHVRLWEVAGTAHADAYGLATGGLDVGDSPDAAAVVLLTSVAGGLIQCDAPVNSGPQHYVLNAALRALVRWVRTGRAPRSAPLLETGESTPGVIARDALGNALGGIRTPYVDAPVATLTGHQDGSLLCLLVGSTSAFDDATFSALYPTRRAFESAWNASLRRAVRRRWILPPDARQIRAWAAAAELPL